MSARRLAILGALDLALAAALLLLPSRRHPQPAHLLPRAPVSVTLARPGEPTLEIRGLTSLLRAGAPPEPLTPAAAAQLEAALADLTAGRRLAHERPEYQLSPPRATITADGTTLALGAVTPTGDCLYARDARGVLVVARPLAEAFLIPLGRLREAHLFTLDPHQPITVELGDLGFERAPDGRAWVDSAPLGRRRAAPEATARLLAVLSLLETSSDAVPPAAPTGAPILTVRAGARTLTLLDAPCTGREQTELIQVDTRPACLPADSAAALRALAAADYTDPGLLPHLASDVMAIELEAGAARLAVTRAGGGFRWTGSDPGYPIDSDAVEDFLRELAAARARAVVPLPDPSTASARLILTLPSGARETIAQLGRPLRRDEEAFALDYPGSAPWFDADPLRFRERQLVSENPTDLGDVQRAGRPAPALAASIATLRATGWEHGPLRAPTRFHARAGGRDVDFLLDPPGPDGACRGRLAGDDATFVLSAPTCVTLAP